MSLSRNRALAAGFPFIQVPVLPVQPGMTQLVRQNVAASRDGKAFADINGLGFGVPDAVGIGVPPIHLGIRQLTDCNTVPERKHDSSRYSHRHNLLYSIKWRMPVWSAAGPNQGPERTLRVPWLQYHKGGAECPAVCPLHINML